jgi:hypothetical protein
MKKKYLRNYTLCLVFLTCFTVNLKAQYFLNISNSLTPACSWSIQVTDNMGNTQTITSTGVSACFANTPVSINLIMAGCATLTWTSGGTWTGPFSPPTCLPSSFCTPGSGNFSINTGVLCGGVSSDEYVFSF